MRDTRDESRTPRAPEGGPQTSSLVNINCQHPEMSEMRVVSWKGFTGSHESDTNPSNGYLEPRNLESSLFW